MEEVDQYAVFADDPEGSVAGTGQLHPDLDRGGEDGMEIGLAGNRGRAFDEAAQAIRGKQRICHDR